MEGLILVSGLIMMFLIHAKIAKLMEGVAIAKGYGKDAHAWAICFWLGYIGYLYVIALPDKVVQSQNQQIINVLKINQQTEQQILKLLKLNQQMHQQMFKLLKTKENT